MKITIASGKGGTGKTTVALSLAWIYSNVLNKRTHLSDCDVDAPNAHLFVQKNVVRQQSALVRKPSVDMDKCTRCGTCQRACHYNAITVLLEQPLIFEELCHSCGACEYVCPENAISYDDKAIGAFQFIDKTNAGFALSWGELFIGEVQAPEMIRQLKSMKGDEEVRIYDASPGAGCPVRETMIGSDVVLLVTEPTRFGLNDLKMAAALAHELNIPVSIIVNRSKRQHDLINDFSNETGIPIIGRIPFDPDYANTIARGRILVLEHPELIPEFSKISEVLLSLTDKRTAAPEIKICKFNEQPVYQSSNKKKPEDVKEFVIMSGKGGTGKTTLSAALANLTSNSLFFDADVDASNLPIILKGERLSERRFMGSRKAKIDQDRCTHCNACVESCHFNAITDEPKIIPQACEGCGFCTMVCPENAITMEHADTGYLFVSRSEKGLISHAFLHIGEENSGKLVSRVRDQANGLAEEYSLQQILGDGPPGTGCPVISATTGADMAVIVTEPSMSGVHDLKRAIDLTKHFNINAVVVINKADMNADQNLIIHDYCKTNHIDILGEIPFDEIVELALESESNIMKYSNSPAALAIKGIYDKLNQTYMMK
jgi:MinD superfamily P-loop ATPase